jgi:hypothetical protein
MKFAWGGLILATLSIPAHAEWVEWSSSTSGTVWYLDPDRMALSPGKVKLWVKLDHARDASVKARSSMQQVSINCRDSKYYVTARTSYDSYGKIMFSQNYTDNGYGYEPIIPETMMESVASVICTFPKVKE